MKSIGVDVGGTFTDLVYCDTATGRVAVHKVATDARTIPRVGVMTGMRNSAREDGRRAVRDRLCASTAPPPRPTRCWSTRGAPSRHDHQRGVSRHPADRAATSGPQHYSIMQEIPGRTGRWSSAAIARWCGERLIPPPGVRAGAARRGRGARGGAGVEGGRASRRSRCAFCSPISTRRTSTAPRQIVREEMPDAFVTTSSAVVAPQFREFERFTTTAMNALHRPEGAALHRRG